ncbi:metalloregulator ArsR/SmtB family transcription factor [Sinomonas sp. ASV322]|uniref:ArsR/SmtB family transcription factor n=1 Tax=Sinomonas sp. ASV322 TaxID=3041920 RepID=UPI0027DAB633|nr:metalloregulator ArsR/SmtB family transcription factor [Sinomonas sp. ASV322]MDQ4501341.1 metalloregulator ArsR/SmtB family transcription factor [Sinomonas sp. ASV322]
MHEDSWLGDAAQFLKVLGNAPRLRILLHVSREPSSVASLVSKSGMSQALVSQHLRTLRLAGAVRAVRSGRDVTYHVTDGYVTQILMHALAHVDDPEARPQPSPSSTAHHRAPSEVQAPAALPQDAAGATRSEPSRHEDPARDDRQHTRHLHRLDAIVKTFMAYEHIGSDTHLD